MNPLNMKAIVSPNALPILAENSLIEVSVPRPIPGPRDLLIQVKAVSVNPVDYKIRQSPRSADDAPLILGWDASGIVEAVGTDVTLFKKGDEVFYAGEIERSGTNAEYHLVDERIVGKKPKNLSFEESSALPLTAITAWESLFERLDLQKGSPAGVLIIGAAGGVGSMAIQLIKSLTSHKVIATASRLETAQWCRDLGADYILDHSKNLVEQVKEQGVLNIRYVLSLTHSHLYRDQIVELIEPQGKLVLIDDPETFDITPFKEKSVSVGWELMFTRSLYKTEDMIEQHHLLNKVAELCEAEKIKSTVTTSLKGLSSKNFKEAHALLESGRSMGKIVVSF